jgi:hypothetical protein
MNILDLYEHIVAYWLKARIAEPALQTSIARQWLSNRHVIAATVAYAKIEEMF